MKATPLGFSFDLARCSGCLACVTACLDQNDLPARGIRFRQVTRVETGAYPNARIAHVSLACLHCGEAPCVAVCPRGAISKRVEDGIVVVDPRACIGCHACATVCPVGAPQFPGGAGMAKCDLCLGRVASGLEPACVRTCPTRALAFGPLEELADRLADRTSGAIVAALSPSLVLGR